MKNTISYEIFVQPDSGPLTVHERGFNGEISFLSPEIAIETAKKKKEIYPNLDFIVLENTSIGWSSEKTTRVIYKTKKYDFATFPLKFNCRADFERAHKFTVERHSEFDAGYADMILTFFSEENREEMLQIFGILGLSCEKI